MIEQSKQVAQRLREMSRYPNVRISPSDPETQKEAAGVIDALRVNHEATLGANAGFIDRTKE